MKERSIILILAKRANTTILTMTTTSKSTFLIKMSVILEGIPSGVMKYETLK